VDATDTRQRILEAALACFVEAGYDRAAARARRRVERGVVPSLRLQGGDRRGALRGGDGGPQDGYWRLLATPPTSLDVAVTTIVTHQLTWVTDHPDQARLLYALDYLDPASAPAGELGALNRDLAGALRGWLAPLVAAGSVRDLPIELLIAIVNGPAHAICRRWLAGYLTTPPFDHFAELSAAAIAGLTGTPTSTPPRARLPATAEIQLLNDDGYVVATGRIALER
jgi:hypothetical protein